MVMLVQRTMFVAMESVLQDLPRTATITTSVLTIRVVPAVAFVAIKIIITLARMTMPVL